MTTMSDDMHVHGLRNSKSIWRTNTCTNADSRTGSTVLVIRPTAIYCHLKHLHVLAAIANSKSDET